jgi:hypothetical protein
VATAGFAMTLEFLLKAVCGRVGLARRRSHRRTARESGSGLASSGATPMTRSTPLRSASPMTASASSNYSCTSRTASNCGGSASGSPRRPSIGRLAPRTFATGRTGATISQPSTTCSRRPRQRTCLGRSSRPNTSGSPASLWQRRWSRRSAKGSSSDPSPRPGSRQSRHREAGAQAANRSRSGRAGASERVDSCRGRRCSPRESKFRSG